MLEVHTQSRKTVGDVLQSAHASLGGGARAQDSGRLVLLPPGENWPKTAAEVSHVCRREPFRSQSRLCGEGFVDGSKVVLLYLEKAKLQLKLQTDQPSPGGGDDDPDDENHALTIDSLDLTLPTAYPKDKHFGPCTALWDITDAVLRDVKGFDVKAVAVKVATAPETTWSRGDVFLGFLSSSARVAVTATLVPRKKKNGFFGKVVGDVGPGGKLLKENNGEGLRIEDLKKAFAGNGDYKDFAVLLHDQVRDPCYSDGMRLKNLVGDSDNLRTISCCRHISQRSPPSVLSYSSCCTHRHTYDCEM